MYSREPEGISLSMALSSSDSSSLPSLTSQPDWSTICLMLKVATKASLDEAYFFSRSAESSLPEHAPSSITNVRAINGSAILLISSLITWIFKRVSNSKFRGVTNVGTSLCDVSPARIFTGLNVPKARPYIRADTTLTYRRPCKDNKKAPSPKGRRRENEGKVLKNSKPAGDVPAGFCASRWTRTNDPLINSQML